MRLMSLKLWQDRICNKYTKYAFYIALSLVIMYIFKTQIHLLLKWVLIDTIGVFITNSIDDESFRNQVWTFVFNGGLITIIGLIFKKDKK